MNQLGNKEKIKQYRQDNKQKRKQYNQERIENETPKQKEERLRKQRVYRKENKEKFRRYAKKWRENNKEKLQTWSREKYQNDPTFRLVTNLRNRLAQALRTQSAQKNNRTMSYTNCTVKFLYEYLECQFTYGMNWKNMGTKEDGTPGWDIDHIKTMC